MRPSPSPSDLLKRLEPRERRAVIGGAVFCALLLLTVWVVLPFGQHWISRESRMEAMHQRWARLASLVVNADRASRALDAARQTTAVNEDRLVEAPTPALAASALQEVLQHDASQSAVQLQRVDAAGESHADKSGLLAIPVQFQARGDVYGLVDFLTRLERGGPLLVIDELTVDDEAEADDDAATSSSQATLSWTVRLHGLYDGTVKDST